MAGPPSPKRQRTGEKNENAAAPSVDVEKLQKVLEDVAAVDELLEAENVKMAGEVLVIESKYNTVKRPFFEKRSKLLREIPGFWKQALSNHPFIAGIIGEEEEKVLESLVDLDVKFVDKEGGFKIEFTFAENPYFGKTTLWKQVVYKDGDEVDVTASTIKWKDTPEAKEAQEQSSFFEWLTSTEGDEDIAENIKDDLWKNPVMFYAQDDDESEEGEEGGDDDEEDDSAEDEE